jgi:hypothetical protein
MEEVSLPIEKDGEKESDHHDRSSDDRDPSSCDEGIEEDTRDGETSRQFLDRDGEEKKFGALQNPDQ